MLDIGIWDLRFDTVDPHSLSLTLTLLLVFTAALGGGIVAKIFKLPFLLGYIIAGVAIGNIFRQGIDVPILSFISDAGITLLLFTLGVEFSFHRLKKIVPIVTWPVTVQILLVFVFFFVFLSFVGFPTIATLFIASAISLSSTAIIVKFLGERGELETIPGELTTGWLIVQDLWVIPFMLLLPILSLLSSMQSVSLGSIATSVTMSLLKIIVIVIAGLLLGKHGIPRLLDKIASLKSREIFLVATIGIVFLSAIAFYALGLSAPVGAFVAGLLIAETSQNHAIFAEVRPLRDIFVVIFFVTLGMTIPFSYVLTHIPLLIGLSLCVLVVKWIVVFGLVRMRGYHRKTAFLTGLFLIPMSEFGFILAKEGVSVRALSSEHYVFIISLTFFTLLLSTLITSNSQRLYYWFHAHIVKRLPKIFPILPEEHVITEDTPLRDHIVICGYGRVGKYIGRALEMAQIPYVVVDYNHSTVALLREKGVKVIYGDPADKDVLDFAEVDFAKVLVIAIPDRHTQELIISHAHTLSRKIKIICRTHFEEDQNYLKSLGVNTIVQPEFEAALSIVTRLLSEFGVSEEDINGKVSRLKIEHGLG